MPVAGVHSHSFLDLDPSIREKERRTGMVVLITASMMIAEIIIGWLVGSMAVFADGWHMATHAGALLITFFAYRLARSKWFSVHSSFGGGKLLPLGAYTSALLLGAVAIWMAFEAVIRIMRPVQIYYNEALAIAVLGLMVNVGCAILLRDKFGHPHHAHDHHHDINIRSAYLHVLADALTSVLAVIALLGGKLAGMVVLDPLIGLIGSAVILVWAWSLLRQSGWQLLDCHARGLEVEDVRRAIEQIGGEVLDLHLWQVAPEVIICALAVKSRSMRGPEFYHSILREQFGIVHATVEEHSSQL